MQPCLSELSPCIYPYPTVIISSSEAGTNAVREHTLPAIFFHGSSAFFCWRWTQFQACGLPKANVTFLPGFAFFTATRPPFLTPSILTVLNYPNSASHRAQAFSLRETQPGIQQHRRRAHGRRQIPAASKMLLGSVDLLTAHTRPVPVQDPHAG